jgi:hypothetical protein
LESNWIVRLMEWRILRILHGLAWLAVVIFVLLLLSDSGCAREFSDGIGPA